MAIEVVVGDAGRPPGAGKVVVMVPSAVRGRWKGRIAAAISGRSRAAEDRFDAIRKARVDQLGSVDFVDVDRELTVAIAFVIQGRWAGPRGAPVRWGAFEEACEAVAREAKAERARVCFARIGFGVGGASWVRAEEILEKAIAARGVGVVALDARPQLEAVFRVAGGGPGADERVDGRFIDLYWLSGGRQVVPSLQVMRDWGRGGAGKSVFHDCTWTPFEVDEALYQRMMDELVTTGCRQLEAPEDVRTFADYGRWMNEITGGDPRNRQRALEERRAGLQAAADRAQREGDELRMIDLRAEVELLGEEIFEATGFGRSLRAKYADRTSPPDLHQGLYTQLRRGLQEDLAAAPPPAAAAQISYLRGDATAPIGDGRKILVHVCNDVGGWGKGFVRAISARWREPERAYRAWYAARAKNDFALGAVQLVQVTPELWVANLIGQRGLRATPAGPPVRYDAIESGLGAVAERARALRATVHMPRIGCGLAGGTWDRIEPVVQRALIASGVAVTVYDWS